MVYEDGRYFQYHCYHCGSKNTEPVIIINDWFHPREDGNPWHCKDCDEYFVHRNCDYMTHIEHVRHYTENIEKAET